MKKLLTFGLYVLPLIAFAANFTEPRRHAAAATVTVPSRPFPAQPAKVVIYKSRGGRISGFAHVSEYPWKLDTGRPSVQEVKAYVSNEATEYGVNPRLALWIVKHESHFNPAAKGDGEASRGLWQISRVYHPEVSDAQAFGVASSTKWSLERIRSGKANEWSTYRNCRAHFADCPLK